MLAEHAAVREEFEQRLAEIWRPTLDFFEMVSVSCLEAGFDLYEAQAPRSSMQNGPTVTKTRGYMR